MSCETLDQQSTRLSVSAGALPEGFCPESMQDLFNAMAARLIVTPSANFAGITMGSIEPSGNVGLWLKDCEELFIFDDATARYVPITKGGFNNIRYYGATDTFVVPPDIYKLKINVWGAGGGGTSSDGAGVSGSGGGGGAFGLSIVDVLPAQLIPFTIGVGGTIGVNGGDTTILARTAGGGKGATSVLVSGLGGTVVGFDVNFSGQAGEANSGGNSSDGGSSGGDAGGWGGKGGTVISNSIALVPGREGTTPGGGGSGGGNAAASVAGAGANGGIAIEW